MMTDQCQDGDLLDGPLDVAFGRSPLGGKKTSEVKFRTTDELKFALQRRAHQLGVTESELCELYAAVGLFGVEHVRMVQERRFAEATALCPVGPTTGASTEVRQ